MPSQTPMIGTNCDLGNAMIKTKTLRYNHKKEGVSQWHTLFSDTTFVIRKNS